MINLAGKVAVVTGASRGLGARVALRLAKHGATIVLVACGEAPPAATATRIREAGGAGHVVAADLGQAANFEKLRDTVAEVAGAPSILVNALETAILEEVARVWSAEKSAVARAARARQTAMLANGDESGFHSEDGHFYELFSGFVNRDGVRDAILAAKSN